MGTQTAQPQQQRITQTGRAHKRPKHKQEIVTREDAATLVGEYHAQSVGVREMLGPKTEPHRVTQVEGSQDVVSAPVVFSAAPPPEIVSGPRRVTETLANSISLAAPPVTYSAPPAAYAGAPV